MSNIAPKLPSYGSRCLLAALERNKRNNTVTEVSQTLPSVGTPVLTELQPLDEILDETLDELIPLDQPPPTDFDNPFSDNEGLGVFENDVNAFIAEHINHNIAEYDSIEVETSTRILLNSTFKIPRKCHQW